MESLTQTQPSETASEQSANTPVGNQLNGLATLNPVAKLLADFFVKRARQRRKTTLTRLQRDMSEQYKQDIDWDQLVNTFQAYQNAGLGILVTGRHTNAKQHYFKWSYNLRDAARAILGQIKPEEMSKAPEGLIRRFNPKTGVSKFVNPKTGRVVKTVKKGESKKTAKKKSPSKKSAAAPVVAPAPVQDRVEVVIIENGELRKYDIPKAIYALLPMAK
jgi:hypothetical protein